MIFYRPFIVGNAPEYMPIQESLFIILQLLIASYEKFQDYKQYVIFIKRYIGISEN